MMHCGNLKCRLGCFDDESQTHIFENCETLKSKDSYELKDSIQKIFGSVIDQKESIHK